MQPFVVTLCGLLLYRGIARWYTADSTQGFGYGEGYETLEWLMSGRTYNIPHTFIFLLVVAAIMGVVLHRSVYGRYLFAVGKNEEAARFSGIPTNTVITTAYIIAGTLAGISSVFFVFYTQSVSPSAHGNFYELYAIAAAVLGGCSLRGGEGSIVGIVLGTVLLQVLQNLVNILGIPSSLNFAVMGAVILLGVLADQQLQRRRQRKLAMASAEARALTARKERPGLRSEKMCRAAGARRDGGAPEALLAAGVRCGNLKAAQARVLFGEEASAVGEGLDFVAQFGVAGGAQALRDGVQLLHGEVELVADSLAFIFLLCHRAFPSSDQFRNAARAFGREVTTSGVHRKGGGRMYLPWRCIREHCLRRRSVVTVV